MFFSLIPLIISAATSAIGGQLLFDSEIYPEQAGWTRTTFGATTRTVTNSIFVQKFDSSGDADYYRRSISEYSGAQNFYAEWRMGTDAPAFLLDTLQVPAGFVLGGNTNVFFHFRFTDTVALFTRSDLALIYYPIEPNVLHTYRIELLDDDTYRFLVDGFLVDSGIQPGTFPTSASEISWGGAFYQPSQTIQWNYIRYGVIPEPATLTLLLTGSALLALRRAKAQSPSKDYNHHCSTERAQKNKMFSLVNPGGSAQVLKFGAGNLESSNSLIANRPKSPRAANVIDCSARRSYARRAGRIGKDPEMKNAGTKPFERFTLLSGWLVCIQHHRI